MLNLPGREKGGETNKTKVTKTRKSQGLHFTSNFGVNLKELRIKDVSSSGTLNPEKTDFVNSNNSNLPLFSVQYKNIIQLYLSGLHLQ